MEWTASSMLDAAQPSRFHLGVKGFQWLGGQIAAACGRGDERFRHDANRGD
jgi:hypothetical protein